MTDTKIVIPNSCWDCPCEYDNIYCSLCSMSFDDDIYPIKPDWCPLVGFIVKETESDE